MRDLRGRKGRIVCGGRMMRMCGGFGPASRSGMVVFGVSAPMRCWWNSITRWAPLSGGVRR